jgi:NAD+ kinase
LNKVGVTFHPKSEAARRIAGEIRTRLASRVADVWVEPAFEGNDALLEGTELLICFGGDGTMLRAARAVIPHPVRLLGVNMGRIGFLTELTPAALLEQLDAIIDGAGRIEARAMIETELRREGETAGSRRLHGLNDAAVGRAAFGRTVQFTVGADDTTVGNYRADGVIVATATGSTAYSLSVGGPILHPESREIIVTPVAPHLAPANSMIMPEGARVEVRIASGEHAILSVDGQENIELTGGEVVCARTSEHVARFLRLGPPGDFYVRVGRRLNWLSE